MKEGKKVLIVEDDIDFASTLSLSLALRKHTTAMARTGREALQMAREQIFDICFLDIKMPGMSGIECLRKIRSLLPENTRYVVMTGFRDKATLAEAEKANPDRILLKPFSMKDFISCAEGAVN